jgi:hypothetical protein
MRKKKKIWMLGLCLLVAFCTSLYAQGVRIVHLGDGYVEGKRDRDTIRVGRSSGTFRAIQLRVSGGAVNFDRVVVRYGNGTQDVVPVRNRIPAGGQTRIFDRGRGESQRRTC